MQLFHDSVAKLVEQQSVGGLAECLDVESKPNVANALVLAAAATISGLSNRGYDGASWRPILAAIESPETIERLKHDPSSLPNAGLISDDHKSKLVAALADRTGIQSRSAAALIGPTVAAVLEAIAEQAQTELDPASLHDLLRSERVDLEKGGWGAWLTTIETGMTQAKATKPVQEIPTGQACAPESVSPEAPEKVDVEDTHAHPDDARIGNADPGNADGGDADASQVPMPFDPAAPEGHAQPDIDDAAAIAKHAVQPTAKLRPEPPAQSPVEATPQISVGPKPFEPTADEGTQAYQAAPLLTEPDPERSQGRRTLILLAAAFLIGPAMIAFAFSRGDSASTEVAEVSGTTPTDDLAEIVTSTTTAAAEQETGTFDVTVQMEDSFFKVAPDATGTAVLSLKPETNEVCYEVTAENIGTPYAGHIHVGGPDVKGGIVVDFGPLENGVADCQAVPAVELNAIIANPGGHYAEMHDPGEEFTIRGQLGEVDSSVIGLTAGEYDPSGGGAVTVITAERITLEGAVADQATADKLAAEVAGFDPEEVEVVNNLTVVPGSPLPTGRIIVADQVLFPVNSNELSDSAAAIIQSLTLLSLSNPDWTVTVVGHTDSSGSAVDNLELSLERARAVKDALVAADVPEDSLIIEGAGETDPIADNETDEGKAQNRRIEFSFNRG